MKRGHPAPSPYPVVLVVLACVCGLGLLAYLNSLHVPFVFDDGLSIERNNGVRFGEYFTGSWLWSRSLLFLTFALNHKFGGMDVFGYHAVNLVLHLLNGVLVFLFARRTFARAGIAGSLLDWSAGISAALFLLHPVQTESVTYISSRTELLSTLFYTAALLLYAYWPERQIGFVLALIVLVLFGLGFASKETVISLPISLFLYDFIFISKCEFRSLLERWRFHSVFIALGVAAATYLLQQWRQYLQPDPTLLSPWQYFLTQTRVIVHYVQLLVVPVGLNLDYDFRASKSVLDPSVLICAAILIALLTAAFYWRRSRPIIAFAIFWFFITLAPTSSLIPIQDVIFEHRLYLPLVAVCLILPVLVRQKAVTCGVLALCLVGTIYRNYTWGDEVRLYSDIVQKSPAKARAYNALTVAYVKRGDVEDAIATAQNGIANVAGSGKYELYTILGNLYLQSGRYNDAIDAYDVAVAGEDPAAVYNNLGIAYLRLAQQLRSTPGSMSADDLLTTSKKLLSQAENAFLESYHRDSSNFASLDTYVDVRHQEDDVGVWRSELAGELQQKPTFESYYSLGKLSWLDHNYKEAVEYFENALRTGRDDKLLRYNYAFALAQTDQVPLAIDQYLNAIRKDPAFWEAHFNVALLYLSRDDTQNAVAHLEEVLRLKPGHPPTLLHLARLFIQQNQPARARPYLQEVLRINPQDPEALSLFKRLGS